MNAMLRFVLAALLAATACAAHAADTVSAAPLFQRTLHAVDGPPLPLASLQGKPLLVNFWARWCAPCRSEIPELAAAQRRHRDAGVVVVGIAVEDLRYRDHVRDFSRAYDLDYLSLIGGAQEGIDLMRELGNGKAGLPFTVLIGRDGSVRRSRLGALSGSEIDAAIAALR